MDPLELVVEGVDFVVLAQDVIFPQATGIGGRTTVVADPHIGIAALAYGESHAFDGIAPVAVSRVEVQHAPDIGCVHQLGESARGSGLDLAQALAHFRRDIAEVQVGEERGFILALELFRSA